MYCPKDAYTNLVKVNNKFKNSHHNYLLIRVNFSQAYARKREFLDNGLVVTNSGKLFCQKIIHVRARSSEKGWVSSIVRTLETVNMLGLTSVAFPALGTGKVTVPMKCRSKVICVK